MSKYVKWVSRHRRTSLTSAGNKGVWVWSIRLHKYVNPSHPGNMRLKDSQIRWIVQEERKGDLTNAQIAENMGVTVRWVQGPWARHRNRAPPGTYRTPPPWAGPPPTQRHAGRREHCCAVCTAGGHAGAAALRRRMPGQT